VVTDSTSDIPAHVAAELGITVVPLTITFGGESFQDGIDLTPESFLERLTATDKLPSTSQPPTTAFEAAFREALGAGQGVVCVTLSSELSGTHNAARLAAEAIGSDQVTVIDTRSVTMALGWVAIAAARLARDGGTFEEVTAGAASAVDRVKLFAVLKSLDYVYKGGRIGRASQLVGTTLGIKPILSFVDGVLVPVERVRLWKRAVARVVELITPTPTDIFVMHTANLEDAEHVAGEFRTRYPNSQVSVGYVGATVATYAGPGAIGVAALYA
jgi:DegV family protein with EDD domain